MRLTVYGGDTDFKRRMKPLFRTDNSESDNDSDKAKAEAATDSNSESDDKSNKVVINALKEFWKVWFYQRRDHETFWSSDVATGVRLVDPFGRLSKYVAQIKGKAPENDDDLWSVIDNFYVMINEDIRDKFLRLQTEPEIVVVQLQEFTKRDEYKKEAVRIEQDKVADILELVINARNIPPRYEWVRDLAQSAWVSIHLRETATIDDVIEVRDAITKSWTEYQDSLNPGTPSKYDQLIAHMYAHPEQAGTPKGWTDDEDDAGASRPSTSEGWSDDDDDAGASRPSTPYIDGPVNDSGDSRASAAYVDAPAIELYSDPDWDQIAGEVVALWGGKWDQHAAHANIESATGDVQGGIALQPCTDALMRPLSRHVHAGSQMKDFEFYLYELNDSLDKLRELATNMHEWLHQKKTPLRKSKAFDTILKITATQVLPLFHALRVAIGDEHGEHPLDLKFLMGLLNVATTFYSSSATDDDVIRAIDKAASIGDALRQAIYDSRSGDDDDD